MDMIFEELDYQKTSLGEISLRRRSEPRLNNEIVYEVKLNEDFLMSSLFTEAEIQLANLGLAALEHSSSTDGYDIIVGGLGLGYTAAAALNNSSVRSLLVIEILQPVIDWHKNGLVPLGKKLTADSRCSLMNANFYEAAAAAGCSFDSAHPDRRAHAVLLDIDHSPSHLLNPGNRSFYSETGLRNLADKLHPGGIFGLWSNELPDVEFINLLNLAFENAEFHLIAFPNPYTGSESSNTVYLAFKK